MYQSNNNNNLLPMAIVSVLRIRKRRLQTPASTCIVCVCVWEHANCICCIFFYARFNRINEASLWLYIRVFQCGGAVHVHHHHVDTFIPGNMSTRYTRARATTSTLRVDRFICDAGFLSSTLKANFGFYKNGWNLYVYLKKINIENGI